MLDYHYNKEASDDSEKNLLNVVTYSFANLWFLCVNSFIMNLVVQTYELS